MWIWEDCYGGYGTEETQIHGTDSCCRDYLFHFCHILVKYGYFLVDCQDW